MSQGLFPKVSTTLDLNGPVLSFTTNPVGVATTSGESVTLTGIATVSFGSTADNTGSIAYRWYEVGAGALNDGSKFTGTGTTTLTILNASTPSDNNRKFYLQADYVPSVETGNASNEPLASDIATITVDPLIEIVAEPTDSQALVNTNTTFTINAGLTDSTYGNVTYQWYLNGNAVNDGVVTSTTSATQVDQTYTSDTSITLPSDSENVEVTIAGASGGNGGSDANGPGGGGGNGRAGKFTLPDGARTLTFDLGRRGNGGGTGNQNVGGSAGSSDVASGGNGGGAGQDGWSGGGGGGGGASGLYDSTVGGYVILSGAGGGGGGGSLNRGGSGGSTAGGFGSSSGPFSISSGGGGQTKDGDGGGGGGGGGGATGGGGGGAGQDNSFGGGGGSGGGSKYNSNVATFGSQWENNGDGYANLKFTTQTTIPGVTIQTTTRTTVSGTKTPTLTIKSDKVGIQTVSCVITNTNATNNPQTSNSVNFAVVSDAEQYNVYVEAVGVTDNASLTSINLFNGDYEFLTSVGDPNNNALSSIYSFYSLDKDIDVEMDLYGAKGDNVGSYVGGEGGFSRIRFTMTQNTEYVIAGLTNSINSPFVYRKGTLIACVGKGGSAGLNGNGGFGGGIGIGGQSGFGRNAGVGGVIIAAGNLPSNGIFGSYTGLTATAPDTKAVIPNGGRVLPCTKGVYWRQQGFSACSDVGSSKYRLSDGTIVTNTATITRGYKAGYNIIQNSGAGIENGGRGGNGATGGQGGDGGGGGGGSGYTDGSITVVDTQLGGSTFANAKIILRVVTS